MYEYLINGPQFFIISVGETMTTDGIWLPIVEYSKYRGISISTTRRYIKNSQVVFKKDKGKFLIFVTEENYLNSFPQDRESLSANLEIERLKNELKVYKEENNDLKMLVQLYESKKSEPPTVPL